MSLETWIAFAIATELILIIPGPSVLLVVAYALSRGQAAGLKCVLGCSTGAAFAFVAAFAGLGALLTASSTAFTAVKLVGAAYLVYLGIKMWRSRPAVQNVQQMEHIWHPPKAKASITLNSGTGLFPWGEGLDP